jgi:hypothetical protein
MAGRHAVREFLQGSLLLARGQAAPVGNQLIKLLLIDGARARAAWVAGVIGGILRGIRILRLS